MRLTRKKVYQRTKKERTLSGRFLVKINKNCKIAWLQHLNASLKQDSIFSLKLNDNEN